jgi:hypothetical protein
MNKQQKATLRIKALGRLKFDVYFAQQRYELENNEIEMEYLTKGMTAIEDKMERMIRAEKEFNETIKKLS